MLDRIELHGLDTALGGQQWESTVEVLALSFIKHNVAIVKVGDSVMDIVRAAHAQLDSLEAPSSGEASAAAAAAAAPSPSPSPRLSAGRVVWEHRLGTEQYEAPTGFTKAFLLLDKITRAVLAQMCRSCHIRLPSYTFQGFLDDMPLQLGTASSSLLQAVRHMRAPPSPLTGARGSSGARPPSPGWLLTQEGASDPGFAAAVMACEAVDPVRGAVSKLQVKDRAGAWIDVKLAADEVAVFLGQTAERATAGLLKAGVFRTVGELHAGAGRRSLEFSLRARPDAVIDLAGPLQAAGHAFNPRRAVLKRQLQSVCMSDLTRQFEEVLTPAHQTEGHRHAGSAGSSLEMSTIASADLHRRSRKKRASLGSIPAPSSPVTRSGKVARTSTGLVNRARHSSIGCTDEQGAAVAGNWLDQAVQNQRQDGSDHAMAEAAPDQAVPMMDLPPASAELLCVTVDGQGRSTQDFMTLRLVHTPSMAQAAFRVHPQTPLSRLFTVFCDTVGLDLSRVKFEWQETRLMGADACGALPNGGPVPIIVRNVY